MISLYLILSSRPWSKQLWEIRVCHRSLVVAHAVKVHVGLYGPWIADRKFATGFGRSVAAERSCAAGGICARFCGSAGVLPEFWRPLPFLRASQVILQAAEPHSLPLLEPAWQPPTTNCNNHQSSGHDCLAAGRRRDLILSELNR